MIVADTPQSHIECLAQRASNTTSSLEVLGGEATFLAGRNTQSLRASKYTLWDDSFEQPKQNLEAKENILSSVKVGSIDHKLKLQANDPLEIYDYPGGYAVRFDGISPSGGDQPQRLQKISKTISGLSNSGWRRRRCRRS